MVVQLEAACRVPEIFTEFLRLTLREVRKSSSWPRNADEHGYSKSTERLSQNWWWNHGLVCVQNIFSPVSLWFILLSNGSCVYVDLQGLNCFGALLVSVSFINLWCTTSLPRCFEALPFFLCQLPSALSLSIGKHFLGSTTPNISQFYQSMIKRVIDLGGGGGLDLRHKCGRLLVWMNSYSWFT